MNRFSFTRAFMLLVAAAGFLACFSGCDMSFSSDDQTLAPNDPARVKLALSDNRVPLEFRQLLKEQSKLLGESLTAAAQSADDSAIWTEYSAKMRDTNEQLTSILADQIIVAGSDGPPIKRINAWQSIDAVLDYVDVSRLKTLGSGSELKANLDMLYGELADGDEPLMGFRMLHIDLPSLKTLLTGVLDSENSENVKAAAMNVMGKIDRALSDK